MEYFDSTTNKQESQQYKQLKEEIVDVHSTRKAIDPWRYEPSQEHLDFIKKRRETKFNREGKSKSGEVAEVARFPIEIHLEMSRLYGNDWVNKPGILPEFLQKNPHYRIGTPMDGLAAMGQIVAKQAPQYGIIDCPEEKVSRETNETVEQAVKQYVEEAKPNTQPEGFIPEPAKLVTSYDVDERKEQDAPVLDNPDKL